MSFSTYKMRAMMRFTSPSVCISIAVLISLLPTLVDSRSAFAGDSSKRASDEPDDVDHVALAARLVRDGHFDRASSTLDKVDDQDESVDRKRVFILRGQIAMHRKLYVAAADAFDSAIAAGEPSPELFVALGKANFGKKDYRAAIDAFARAGQESADDWRSQLILARSHWEVHDAGTALQVLGRAGKRFPERVAFPRLEMFYLIKLGLFRAVAGKRATFLKRTDIGAQDLAAIAEAMRKGGHLEETHGMLEAARLRFPDSEELTVLHARVLMDEGRVLSSAIVLEHAARMNDKYTIEAAEMYRRAGRLERALFINARVSDQQAKIKQRLQILLELERFEMISAMEARLSRLGLLGDDQIRYALAYGFFMIRDFPNAEKHIRRLQDPDVFTRGVQLRKAIQNCQQAGWLCE